MVIPNAIGIFPIDFSAKHVSGPIPLGEEFQTRETTVGGHFWTNGRFAQGSKRCSGKGGVVVCLPDLEVFIN